MLTLRSRSARPALTGLLFAAVFAIQAQPRPGGPRPAQAGPQPTYANLEYAPADQPSSNGHKLDLYIPLAPSNRCP